MIRKRGLFAESFVCDLALRESIDHLVQDVLGHMGNVDILINNAGVQDDFDQRQRGRF